MLRDTRKFFFILLDIPKSNLPCRLLKWLLDSKLGVDWKASFFLLDYTVSKQWDANYLLSSERMPKLIAYV